LDAYIAGTPQPPLPQAPRPDPARAVAVAEEMGLPKERLVACFC
jgi:hypothetical protein